MGKAVKQRVVDQDIAIDYCEALSGGIAESAVEDSRGGISGLASTVDGDNGISSIAAVSVQPCEGDIRAIGKQDVAKVPGIDVEELCVSEGDVGLRELQNTGIGWSRQLSGKYTCIYRHREAGQQFLAIHAVVVQ